MPLSLEGGTTGYGILTVRLRPDVARDVARRQIEAAGPAIAAQARRPWRYNGAAMVPLGEMALTDASRHSVALLFGSTALLLLMVCMNVANLGLARLQARKRDVAIRSALGASRLRLLRETVVEQVLVGLAALAVAEPLTVAGLRLAQALVPTQLTFSSLRTIRLDGRLLAAMTGLAMAAPLLANIVPALAGSRSAVLDVLRLESRSTTGTRRSKTFRRVLVVLEVACAVVLLVSAALLGRSFARLQQTNLGFDNPQPGVGQPAVSLRVASLRRTSHAISLLIARSTKSPACRASRPSRLRAACHPWTA